MVCIKIISFIERKITIKKLVSLFLCLITVLSSTTVLYSAASTEHNFHVDFDKNTNVVTITGTGAVWSNVKISNWQEIGYYNSYNPWDFFDDLSILSGTSRKKATTLVIGEGITELRPFSCSALENVKKVVLPKSLKRIYRFAFFNCRSLESVSAQNVTKIDGGAFFECQKLEKVSFPNVVDMSDNLCHPIINLGEDAKYILFLHNVL